MKYGKDLKYQIIIKWGRLTVSARTRRKSIYSKRTGTSPKNHKKPKLESKALFPPDSHSNHVLTKIVLTTFKSNNHLSISSFASSFSPLKRTNMKSKSAKKDSKSEHNHKANSSSPNSPTKIFFKPKSAIDNKNST